MDTHICPVSSAYIFWCSSTLKVAIIYCGSGFLSLIMHHHATSGREIRVQISKTPLFYVPNGLEINGPTKECDFHFNAGTIDFNYIFHEQK